jgi:hypothetical protein
MINSMLNHVAFLKPPASPTQCWTCVMVCYQKLIRRCLQHWTGREGGGGRETEVCFVNVQLNFVRFAGMLSMVLSKIVGFSYCISWNYWLAVYRDIVTCSVKLFPSTHTFIKTRLSKFQKTFFRYFRHCIRLQCKNTNSCNVYTFNVTITAIFMFCN